MPLLRRRSCGSVCRDDLTMRRYLSSYSREHLSSRYARSFSEVFFSFFLHKTLFVQFFNDANYIQVDSCIFFYSQDGVSFFSCLTCQKKKKDIQCELDAILVINQRNIHYRPQSVSFFTIWFYKHLKKKTNAVKVYASS